MLKQFDACQLIGALRNSAPMPDSLSKPNWTKQNSATCRLIEERSLRGDQPVPVEQHADSDPVIPRGKETGLVPELQLPRLIMTRLIRDSDFTIAARDTSIL